MKKLTSKQSTLDIIFIVTFIGLAVITGYSYLLETEFNGPPFLGPPPFEVIGKMVSYTDVISQFKAGKIRLYLPTYLPEGYKLTAIWVKVDENGPLASH